ncbi:MAG: hypothetical protein H6622_06945 [Halobacteriovoraceae bacterium]|nr:hypothetical protein [Halobacteriovoraceae bacterium]
MLKKFLESRKGSTMLGAMALVGLVVAITWAVLQRLDERNLLKELATNKVVYDEELRGIINLGAYLISNNLVACRENVKFSNNYECIWAGDKLPASPLQLSHFGLKEVVLSSIQELPPDFTAIFAGQYALEVNMQIGNDDPDPNDDIQTNKKIKGYLVFDLQNLAAGDADIAFTKIPDIYSLVDDDYWTVAITAIIAVADDHEEGKFLPATDTKRMRRPIAIPKISISPGSCTELCSTAVSGSLDVNECRSSPHFGKDSSSHAMANVPISVVNMGPGILYGLKLQRSVTYRKDESLVEFNLDDSTFSKDLFSSKIAEEPDFMIMPGGGEVALSDEFDCAVLIEKIQFNGGTIRMRFPGAASGQTYATTTVTNNHIADAGSVKYDLQVSRYSHQDVDTDEKIATFWESYDPSTGNVIPPGGTYVWNNPTSYHENLIAKNSGVEPRRMAEPYFSGESTVPAIKTTVSTTIYVIKTH